jgi:methionine aminopeptidase
MCESDATFDAGMVLGVEAFLVVEGVGTAAFEQNFILHDDGPEIITHSPMFWW